MGCCISSEPSDVIAAQVRGKEPSQGLAESSLALEALCSSQAFGTIAPFSTGLCIGGGGVEQGANPAGLLGPAAGLEAWLLSA